MRRGKEKKLTREHYEKLINIYDGKKNMKKGGKKYRRGTRTFGGLSAVHPETVMLAHFMSSANRNAKQREAVVDLLNEKQVC